MQRFFDKTLSCAILAGGASRRFGVDKTLAELNGKPLIQWVYDGLLKFSDDIAIISKNPSKYLFLRNARCLQDISEKQCALTGVITALSSAKYDRVFVISADLPLFPFNAISMMKLKNGVVIPKIDGKPCPLSAIYPKSALPLLITAFNNNQYKLTSAVAQLPIASLLYPDFQPFDKYFESADINGFLNINTQEDLKTAQRLLNR